MSRAVDHAPAARWRLLHFARSRPWLTSCTLVFAAAVALLLVAGARLASALMFGFDLATLIYLVTLARLFQRASGEQVSRQARRQDTGRRATLAVAVTVSLVVLLALATELRGVRAGGAAMVGGAALSVVLSWLFMNTMFALHYAHRYYGDGGEPRGGLQFPGQAAPDYWDFAYFSFVIGMCFQTSDVNVCDRGMRRLTLLHSVVAFFFNVFILAISVSVVGSLAG